MLKNKKVVLSSIAIIFTLIVCAIFVNFTLANSGTPVEDGEAETSAVSGLVGYSNIDLAIINSNDSSLAGTGQDTFNVVQILPNNCSSYAEADTAMTEIVTASNYSGTISKESQYEDTSDLWKYVYDGEYFRYAVFNGYKTISDEMAEGAVQLTSVTVSDINNMGTDAQEILNNADFIYIVANNTTDYASTSLDISEDLYNWLDSYATVDEHPLAIDWCTLCTDPSSVSGNNDTYRMGALAYKLMTKTLNSRYDNVLVTDPGFFNVLYEEASGNKTEQMTSTTKTIADFIVTAESSSDAGGNDYIDYNTYYKWYLDESMQTFFNHGSSYADSAYAKITSTTSGITGERHEWDYDNAKVLVITDGTSTTMYDQITGTASENITSSSGEEAYKYNSSTETWVSKTNASNSTFTGLAYATTGGYMYVPSGADVFVISAADNNLQAAVEGTGGSFSTSRLANSYFEDITTQTISGTITSPVSLIGSTVYLLATDSSGDTYVAGNEDTLAAITVALDNTNEVIDSSTGTDVYTYSYSIPYLNTDFTYSVALSSEVTNSTSTMASGTVYEIGSNVYDFIVTVENAQASSYDYTSDMDEYSEYITKANADPDDTYYSDLYSSYVYLDTASKVSAYVAVLHSDYVNEVTNTMMREGYFSGDTTLNFTKYDFIIIESGDYLDSSSGIGMEIGDTVYKALCNAVEKGVYFIVSDETARNEDGLSSSDGTGSSSSIIISSPSAKAIADIINAGTYRSGSDNKFRVLEIQPDYPIDVDLAESASSTGSSYTLHSDGSSITGDYYTVPSDVVSGSAKEELTENTEYYDFDLTKAKIAYAIDGISYSDVELTQVSTEALIGMSEDIMATYDLVYIGGDISAMDVSIDQVYYYLQGVMNTTGISALGYAIPTFIMYTHTGILQYITNSASSPFSGEAIMPTGMVNGTTEVYIAENGNDLTSTKYEELIDYIDSGKPIMISDELTSVYEKMNGYNVSGSVNALTQVQLTSGYWFKDDGSLERGNMYLDPSSWMYKLVDKIYDKYTDTSDSDDNILWGVDVDDEQMIANDDAEYGTTLYTYSISDKTIYLDEDAQSLTGYADDDGTSYIKQYAVVFGDNTSKDINNLITDSSKRVRLTISSMPTKYQQGITSTYLTTTDLSFTFVVSGGTKTTYTYAIYVDKDKNTVFDSSSDYYISGSVTVNSAESKTISLDDDFFGAAYWRLEILDGTTVVSSQTGVSKILNTDDDDKSEINVLQIQTMIQGQSADYENSYDTLYFDIGSQWAHKILYYNGAMNNPDWSSNTTFTQSSVLGRHENRFGIVEYDTDSGDDDWLSNLADALTDDYDISLDIAVADSDQASFSVDSDTSGTYECIETWAEEADALEAGDKLSYTYYEGTDSEGNTVISYNYQDGYTKKTGSTDMDGYADLAKTAKSEYYAAMAAVVDPKEEIDEFLNGAYAHIDGTAVDSSKYGTFVSGLKKRGASDETIKKLLSSVVESGEYYLLFSSYFTSSNSTDISSLGSTFQELFVAYRDAKDAELDARDVYKTFLRRSYGGSFLDKMYSILVLGPSNDFGNYKVDLSESACKYIVQFVNNGGDLFFFHDTMTPFYNSGAVTLTEALLDVVGMNRFHVDMTKQSNSYDTAEIDYETPAGMVDVSGQDLVDGVTYYYQTWNSSDTEYSIVSNGSVTGSGYFAEKTITSDNDKWYNIYIYQEASSTTTLSGGEYNAANTGYSSSIYYLTPYANNTTGTLAGIMQTAGLATSTKNNIADSPKSSNGQVSSLDWTISALSMSTMYCALNKSIKGEEYLKYIYAKMDVNGALRATTNGGNHEPSQFSQTAKVSQLNEGLVTLYPFNIGASLNVTGTHQQAYALDLENENTTVWYTLAGTNNKKEMSSMYAASPYDAMESYFIYTTAYGKGAITYCGAGHTSVTGNKTKNNDERMLFINVIVNSAEAVTEKPSIKVYEPDKKLTDELDTDDDLTSSLGKTVYLIEADGKSDTVDFDFEVTIPTDVVVDHIDVYFDTNWKESGRPSNSGDDTLIWTSVGTDEEDDENDDTYDYIKNEATSIAVALRKVQLTDSYFTYTGSCYTYIVVEVYYEGSINPVYSIIKVKVSDPLFELTKADSDDVALEDYIEPKKFSLS